MRAGGLARSRTGQPAAAFARGGDAAELASALDDLVRRYELVPAQATQLGRLLETLAADAHAPTTVRDPLSASRQHLADSLVALEFPAVRAARTIADVGAGAGFPGLALAVALPAATVSLVESVARKCAFIGGAIERCTIANARVVCARVEEWGDGSEANDLVTARALAPPPVVIEYAAPLLRIGGALADWRGRRSADEEDGAQRAAAEVGLELVEIRHVQPFPDADRRHLHLYLKVRATPERFPRRSGMARKRPL